jgi:four helix bundle protein
MTPEELSERLLNFAAKIVEITDALPDTRSCRHIAGQLLRCGTSPAPNYEEACAAESRRDFIHKLGVTLKELRESRLWLKLIAKCKLLPGTLTTPTLAEANELCNIVGKSVVTAKQPPAKKQNAGNQDKH